MALYTAITEYVRRTLTEKRFLHSISTACCGKEIALSVGVCPERAYLAGILHDIARELPDESLLRTAREKGIIPRNEEKSHPILLHGKIAALISKDELGIKDKGVLAIAFHVAGRQGWPRLEQVVYLADKIEPLRDYPGVDGLRRLVETGRFDKALMESLRNTVIYAVQERDKIVDTETVVVFNEVTKAKTRNTAKS